ncbi:ferric reductase-like transmembrane domain-containing protein [Glycomyces scopariae]
MHTAAWVLSAPAAADGRSDLVRQLAGEYLGATAVVLFATATLLSTRARWLEPWFGGLDKMYRAHRETATLGFALLAAHAATTPWRLTSPGGVPSGLLAFAGITVMVALALGPRLPVLRRVITIGYGRWRILHRFVGIFLIMALAHMLLVDAVVHAMPVPFAITMAAFVTGIGAFLYSLLLARLVRPRRAYTVTAVRRLNDATVEIGLALRRGRPLEFHSGQFVFASFRRRGLREPHPFTVSSAAHDPHLRLTVKAAGDFTRRLPDRLGPGVKAVVEGAYGMMDYRRGGPDQVWVAGGIGVTPFLSWCRDLTEDPGHRIDFFYTVRDRADALFWDEIVAVARRHPRLRPHLHVSSEAGSLTVPRIVARARVDPASTEVYLCGPVPMIRALERGFRDAGAPAARIHFEEFGFR